MLGVQLAFAALFAVAGYQESRRFARTYGRSPWGWPDWLWALVLGFSWLIGIVLLAIAERQGRKHPQYGPTGGPMPQSMPVGQFGTARYADPVAYGVMPPAPANPYAPPAPAPAPVTFGDTILPG
ncbi:MAG: hypothetical protein JO214_10615 [Frankiaceae bacterium]|nr:hypothetical protein [Frankiaceae bacterium]